MEAAAIGTRLGCDTFSNPRLILARLKDRKLSVAPTNETGLSNSGHGVIDLTADVLAEDHSLQPAGPFAMYQVTFDLKDLDRPAFQGIRPTAEAIPATDLKLPTHIGRNAPS